MKIAISSSGDKLDSKIADFFGRCPYFIIVETQADKVVNLETFENSAKDQPGGAGPAAVKLIAEKGVELVIANNIGPKASTVLQQFQITVFPGEGTGEEALRKLITKN